MADGYLRDRAIDVKDVGLRILRNLRGIAEPERPLERDSVLVAEELTLSDLTLVDHERLRGIVLATGGVTSHATILAKSFEIPTIVGCERGDAWHDARIDGVHEELVHVVCDGHSRLLVDASRRGREEPVTCVMRRSG